MIKFFQKTRQKQLAKNDFSGYLLYAIGEIVLVVIGILIALSINNWNQKQKERSKEEGYILALIEDAKTDLANFKSVIALNKKRMVNLDSLASRCYNFEITGKEDPMFMEWYMKSLVHPDFVKQTDRTLSQLKNSGGMGLIRNKTNIDALIDYEQSFDKLYNQQEWYEGGLKELIHSGVSVFNFQYFPNPNHPIDSIPNYPNERLLETDAKSIMELGNRASILSLLTFSYLRFLETGQQECLSLIAILEKNQSISN
jgi:hypothetical protein